MSATHTIKWQRITLLSLFTGYAGYYVCRTNLSVAAPLLLAEFADQGITKPEIGFIASLGVFLYATGKVTNGLLADFLGGRLIFLTGMVVSVVCTLLFGLASGLVAFAVLWALNRYCQSMGWGGLIKIAARWYPVGRRALVMGVLSMSYLVGDAAARLYLGYFIRQGVSWRGVFFIAAGTLATIAGFCLYTLKGSPQEVGADEPAANPANVFGKAGNAPQPEGLVELLLPLLTNPSFLLVCLMSVGLTLIRETFNFWTPTYLHEVVGLEGGWAAQTSMLFPLIGASSALLGGWLSDRCQGQHGRVALPALVILTGALWLLSVTSTQGRPVLALLLITGIAFCLLGPYSFCSGVIPLDLGGKRGSSTAAGLIDSVGYLGAILSGYPVGYLAQGWGWPVVFALLAGVAALTTIATGLYWLLQESSFAQRLTDKGATESGIMTHQPKPEGQDVIQRIFKLFEDRGSSAYLGEPVSQIEHALQAAWAAEKAQAASPLIAAALLHDIGHLLHHLPEDCAAGGLDDRHEELGARWVERHFGPVVSEPIRLHVPAKRYLCAAEPSYLEQLSPASQLSLKLQGGPFAPDEVARFVSRPTLRRRHRSAALGRRGQNRRSGHTPFGTLPPPPGDSPCPAARH